MSKDLIQFAREVKQETQKVTWPSRKEVVTTMFVMVVIMALFMMFADWIISSGVKFILTLGTRLN